jgi:hypothetical protein
MKVRSRTEMREKNLYTASYFVTPRWDFNFLCEASLRHILKLKFSGFFKKYRDRIGHVIVLTGVSRRIMRLHRIRLVSFYHSWNFEVSAHFIKQCICFFHCFIRAVKYMGLHLYSRSKLIFFFHACAILPKLHSSFQNISFVRSYFLSLLVFSLTIYLNSFAAFTWGAAPRGGGK